MYPSSTLKNNSCLLTVQYEPLLQSYLRILNMISNVYPLICPFYPPKTGWVSIVVAENIIHFQIRIYPLLRLAYSYKWSARLVCFFCEVDTLMNKSNEILFYLCQFLLRYFIILFSFICINRHWIWISCFF